MAQDTKLQATGVRFYNQKSNAKRKLAAMEAQYPAIAFDLSKGADDNWHVVARLTDTTAHEANTLINTGIEVFMKNGNEQPAGEATAAASGNDGAQPSDTVGAALTAGATMSEAGAADAAAVAANEKARAAVKAAIAKDREERKAKKEAEKQAKLDAAKKALDEKTAAKAAKASKKATEEAAKKATSKATRAAKPASNSAWAESYAKAPALVAKRVTEGKTPFREGTKRDILHNLLLKGVTVEDAMAALAWNKATVTSSFYEMAHYWGKKVTRDDATKKYSYES